jgi:hypothetical protein
MTHRIKPEAEDGHGPGHADSARVTAFDDETLLDHHLEEMLGALGDLELLRLHGAVE